jgi:hypothetical protein
MLEAERVARVQLLYREVNERIQAVGTGAFGLPSDEPLNVVCECLDASCADRITVSARELEQARSSPARFIVLPGHEDVDYEEVLARHAGFLIVAKDEELIARLRAEPDAAASTSGRKPGLQ